MRGMGDRKIFIIYTDNRVTSFMKSSTSSKLKRWRSILDSYRIQLEHRAGTKMLVSDALSRLITANVGDYKADLSDELLNETVIAKQKCELTEVELFQLHQKNGHCSTDRLAVIADAS